MSELSKKKDLTRWNRSGLDRFRYVDGNAVTFLEMLRLAMVESFTDSEGNNPWKALDAGPPAGQETSASQQARWLEQYKSERRDHAWEILRTFARAVHVMGEHLDAYANETHLRTATQWDHVRRLVEMLGHHPSPPASAQTPIALLAKRDKWGLVEKGFAFKNKPEDGSKPCIFETLEDVEVDFRMNMLRPAQWNKSQKLFTYDDSTLTATFPLAGSIEGVSVGTLGVLLIDKGGSKIVGVAVRVTEMSEQELKVQGEAKPADYPSKVLFSEVRLLLKPNFMQAPRLVGDEVAVLEEDHQLSAGAVVAWLDGGSWQAARIEALEYDRVQLSRTAPLYGKELYLAVRSDARSMKEGPRVILPAKDSGDREGNAVFSGSLQRINSVDTHSFEDQPIYDYVPGSSHGHVYYLPKAGGAKFASGRVKSSKPQDLTLEGAPEGLASGLWVITKTSSGIHAATIRSLVEGEKDFTLELSRDLNGIKTLCGDFAIEVRPKDHDVNEEPIFLTSPSMRSDSHSILPLDLDEFPKPLKVGRMLLVAGLHEAMAVTVKEVNVEERWVKVAPPIPGSELSASGTTSAYKRFHSILYGNAVPSGHGETQNEKILGSGDATRTNQHFDLEAEGVTFVADRNFPRGVRAALEVQVGGRTWKQVAALSASEPTDPHYMVRMKQDGTLRLFFGDGRYGRRLPSGSNNLRVRYRLGSGLAGNLEPYSLQKETKPHPLIDGLSQPMASSGGNEMESIESMRENAPGNVLALERAVSLSDFTHLAASNSGVWQARAFRRQPGQGRTEQIQVAVVPAGGGALGELAKTLEGYLTSRALPHVNVSVVRHQSIILDLQLTIKVNVEEYDPDLVGAAVLQQLLRAFSLRKMKLGQSFYRSRVYAVVEAVEGVENCRCRINPFGFRDDSGASVTPPQLGLGREGHIRRISLDESQVIHTDEGQSILDIAIHQFHL